MINAGIMKSIALALFTTFAFADNYSRQPGIDAQHYIFRVSLSDITDQITGEATVDLRFLREGIANAALDLTSLKDGKGMTVTEVTSAGAPVRYTHATDRLTLNFSPPQPGERRQF